MLILMFCAVPFSAQMYKYSHLQKAARELHLDTCLAAMSPSSVMDITAYDGQRLLAWKDKDGWITHIGIPLFTQEIRILRSSPIYNYLEYALLDYRYGISENTLQHRKITFRNGSWDKLLTVKPTDDCSISNIDDRYYLVSWNRNDEELIAVLIPIDYELLSNSNRREMEHNFVRDLKGFVQADTIEKLVLLTDSVLPSDSVPSLLIAPRDTDRQSELLMKVLYADYHRDTLQITVRQLLAFCQANGCVASYMSEGVENGIAAGMILLFNKSEGYAHLVSLRCPLDALSEKIVSFIGELFMYIPISNITTLFGTSFGPSAPKKYEE